MTTLFSYRFLTREQIQELFGFKSIRRVNSRLRKLYDHCYLSRSFLPTIRGSAKAIYFLGPQSALIISEQLGLDIGLVQRKIKSLSKVKEFFLNHAMELNDTRINICQAINNHPETKLETWINDNDCEQTYQVIVNGKEIIKKFRPDGYFRFWYQGKLTSFFLELDRSTMTLGRFKSKVRTYIEFSKLGFYQQRFGVKYFRVLVIAPSPNRILNLKNTVEQVTDRKFLFTTFNQVTSDNALSPIWHRVGHEGLFSIISELIEK